jgi:hypothetical protein
MTTKISTLLPSQLSEYVTEQYPKFVRFLEVYYQYLEQTGQPIDILINQQGYDDIDRTLTDFVPFFKKQYAEFFPDIALVDKRLLIKHIKDFYLAKGSEQAFKMFFQMVYGIKISMIYPSEKILRASDGNWLKKIVIRVSKLTGDPLLITGHAFDFLAADGSVIKTAFCESVQSFTIGQYYVYELSLKVKDVDYTYIDVDAAQTIRSVINGQTITAQLYTMVVDTIIQSGSYGYDVGDIGAIYGTGDGAKISVARTNLVNGGITQVAIDDFGVGYTTGGELVFAWGANNIVWTNSGITGNMVTTLSISGLFQKPDASVTKIDLILGKMGIFPRRFSGSSGLLSSDQRLQDNYYYQIHSYAIESNKSYEDWFNAIRDNAHISGSKAFSSVLLNNTYKINT